ncbi:MAG: hypothetical protein ABR604_01455, partial [Jatrophihabitantaceae bacterium]
MTAALDAMLIERAAAPAIATLALRRRPRRYGWPGTVGSYRAVAIAVRLDRDGRQVVVTMGIVDRMKDKAEDLTKRAKPAAENARDKAKPLAAKLKDRAEQVTESVKKSAENFAEELHQDDAATAVEAPRGPRETTDPHSATPPQTPPQTPPA